MSEPAGAAWVGRYPTSVSVDDLAGSFRTSVNSFLAAMRNAGANVTIAATLRPPERAYLMHWSYMIAQAGQDASKVPAMAGVDIDWDIRDAKGKPDVAATRKAAQAMVDGYGIAYQPALSSRHTEGLAIDMNISWSGNLSITGADGKVVVISSSPRSGGNGQLQAVAARFGVMKLSSDPPHWSSDGH
jgi:hypothetical protein